MHRIPVVLIAVCSLGVSQSALALRCGNNLISKGDHLIEVLKKCGEPAHTDKWVDERTVSVQAKHYRLSKNLFFPRSPQRSQQVTQHQVTQHGHQTTPRVTNLHVRNPHPIRVTQVASRQPRKVVRSRTQSIIVELWTYNFGTRRFMRQLRFENGILKRIKTLSYGYR